VIAITREGYPFWYHPITGESSWTAPPSVSSWRSFPTPQTVLPCGPEEGGNALHSPVPSSASNASDTDGEDMQDDYMDGDETDCDDLVGNLEDLDGERVRPTSPEAEPERGGAVSPPRPAERPGAADIAVELGLDDTLVDLGMDDTPVEQGLGEL